MNALLPTYGRWSQPVDGARPPRVFTRWTNVVSESVVPPVGPTRDPTLTNFTQGIAFGSTVAAATAAAQTMLVSAESCHVARTTRASSGLGLLKCPMICSF